MVAFTLCFTSHFLFSITFYFTSHYICINVVFKDGIKGTGLLKIHSQHAKLYFEYHYEQSSLSQFEFCNAETKHGKNQLRNDHPTKHTFGKPFGPKISTSHSVRSRTKPN